MNALLGSPLAGALTGLLAAVGCALIVAGLPWPRRSPLEARLEPYLRDRLGPSRLLSTPVLPRGRRAGMAVSLVTRMARGVGLLLGDGQSVRRRQRRAGRPVDPDGFRAEQVLSGLSGLACGLAIGVWWWTQGRLPASLAAVLGLVGAGCGVLARDQALSRAARVRERRLLAEFPTTAELLALSVSAGEGAVAALERVCRLSRGELAGELAACLTQARTGAPLPAALQGLADRTDLVGLRRFVDGVVTALERGTPLAEVLRAQAQDVREEGRQALLRTGGRRELAMMVPVVFVILPVTILFAVYPALALLNLTL